MQRVTEMNSVIELQQVVELLTQSPLPTARDLLQPWIAFNHWSSMTLEYIATNARGVNAAWGSAWKLTGSRQGVEVFLDVMCSARFTLVVFTQCIGCTNCGRDHQWDTRDCCNCTLVFCNSPGALSHYSRIFSRTSTPYPVDMLVLFGLWPMLRNLTHMCNRCNLHCDSL